MREYVEPLWGWDEPAQREAFQQRFKLEGHWVIIVDGQDAGRLSLDQSPECDFVSQINLLPEYQGRGIGTAIVEAIKENAGQAGKPVALRVLRTNPDARRLYERLGFSIFQENETHFWMRWKQS